MSLLSDPDYLIHNIRLAYLRHVDDPYGPRILSLNPGYTSNAHILASGLGDQELWPEIVMPSTPDPVDKDLCKDANKRHSGFPGATGLKYSQTIVGQNRNGAMGMRVSGKRASLIRELAPTGEASETVGVRHRSDSEPTPVPTFPGSSTLDPGPDKPVASIILRRRSADASELEEAPASNGPPKVEPFKPPFARAAEMEARRNIRMGSRLASIGNNPKPVTPLDTGSLNPEVSEDEMSGEEDLELVGNDIPLEGEDTVEDDFFDPENEFGPRIVLATSESDGILSTSNSALSTSHSSSAGIFNGSSHLNVRPIRAPLSPVHEVHPNQQQLPSTIGSGTTPPPRQGSDQLDINIMPQRMYKSDGSYFELVVPPMPTRGQAGGASSSASSQVLVRDHGVPNTATIPATTPNASVAPVTSHARQPPTLIFTRLAVPPLPTRPPPSALSQMLASETSKTDNPFSELYALISSRSNPLSLEVIYPLSNNPMKPVTLKVRSDATVEEVIGFALWTYWEEGCLPKLDEDVDGVDDSGRRDRLSAAGWSLRITEDGEVDDDFPAMDRMAKMSKFNIEGYAIMPETPAQTEQNRVAESKIIRRPSRVMVAKKKTTELQTLAPPGPSAPTATSGSLVSLAPVSSSIGGGSLISQGPQQFLRVKVAEKADVHYSTTIPVKESMYMEEVLENVCRRRKIDDPKQWCLVYEMKIFVPLDRTVASLQGKTELFLVKKANLSQYEIRRQQTRSTDPNASIFTRISEVPEQQYSAALDFTSAYKKYTVYRKMPMLVVRHERTLAMDGDYIHIMPSATRAFLDSMKTSSYHIKTVIACMQSAKSSSNFKLVVWRDGGNKRYDFEAESPKVAAEIVRNIRDLRTKRLERSGTLTRSRRSRQAG